MTEKHIVERAFEIARTGDVSSLTEIRARLKSEGYLQLDLHLSGKTIKEQLTRAMRGAQPMPLEPAPAD